MPSTVGTDPLSGIDQVIHAPARLRIVTQLYVVEAVDATFLVNQTGLTWGNLATHLRKLEKHDYVTIEKGYRGRKPNTVISLTQLGREAFRSYRELMQHALGDGS
ncbi:MAG: transcriptional regulator [Acidimicrobiia bacterium]|nr:transcriptional regulator [Acidimicrobiia bacterium]